MRTCCQLLPGRSVPGPLPTYCLRLSRSRAQAIAERGNEPSSEVQPSWLNLTSVPSSVGVKVHSIVVPAQRGGKSPELDHFTHCSVTWSTVSSKGIGAVAKLGFMTDPTPPGNSTVGVHHAGAEASVSSASTTVAG